MSLEAPVGSFADLVDEIDPRPVLGTVVPFRGLIFDVRRDTVDLGPAGVVERDYVEHPGAVLAGRLHNPGAMLAIMAAQGSRARDWATLRPADAPWPFHPAYR